MGARIAIFGGTFDPIHDAHLAVAREAADSFELDRVLFVPAKNPPHKIGDLHAPFDDRMRMVELACAADVRFEASRIEDRPGRSYSFDTVVLAREQCGQESQLFFLIGADAFAATPAKATAATHRIIRRMPILPYAGSRAETGAFGSQRLGARVNIAGE